MHQCPFLVGGEALCVPICKFEDGLLIELRRCKREREKRERGRKREREREREKQERGKRNAICVFARDVEHAGEIREDAAHRARQRTVEEEGEARKRR